MSFDDELARVGNDLVGSLDGGALRGGQVDEVLIRKAVVHIVVVGATGDGDGCAIHVNLPIANLVVPSPSEREISVGEAFGDGEGELVRAIVAFTGCGTTALENLNELEDRRLGRFFVERHGYLTGAPAVRGTAAKGELLGNADWYLVLHTDVVHAGTLLAWVVRLRVTDCQIEQGGGVQGVDAIWYRSLERHVCRGLVEQSECHQGKEACAREHLVQFCGCVCWCAVKGERLCF